MAISFRLKLLLLFSGVLAVALVATIFFSWRTATITIRDNTSRSLDVAQQVMDELLTQRNRQLMERAQVLADDYGFLEAIATGERATIVDVLVNHGGRVSVDMIFLLAPDGAVTATTHDLGALPGEPMALQQNTLNLLYSEGAFYQLAVLPVRAPDLLGWVGMGLAITDALAAELQDIARTDVSFIARAGSPEQQLITTLSRFPAAVSAAATEDPADAIQRALQADGHLSQLFRYQGVGGEKLLAVVSSPLEAAFALWRPWQRQLGLIALGSLLFTAVAAWLVSQSVARPIRSLTEFAQQIGKGDYDTPSPVDPDDREFSFLANTMVDMGQAVREREERILYQARYDALTNLPTRQYLQERVDRHVRDNPDTGFAVLLIQVNKYLRLIEAYGMDWGDELLKLVADQLRAGVGPNDLMARVGRDQFLVFCPGGGADDARQLAARYDALLSQPISCSSIEVKVDLRAGIATSPADGVELNDLLRRAAIALSRAGVGAVELSVYEAGQDLRLLRQIRVTQRLQAAIQHQQGLTLYFQPKQEIRSGQIIEAEALLRWQDEELGRVQPDEFIPLAESSGDILALSEWVMLEAARQAADWHRRGIPVRVAVNVSGRDFQRPDFVERTLATIERAGATTQQLVLEITESATIDDIDQAIQHLRGLRAGGLKLALDDFGTGFSSLSQLKRLPLDELKIDKSFVLQLAVDTADQNIVRSTIELGHNLGLGVVAEGVENQESVAMLQSMGCDTLQGFFLGRPMPAGEFEAWLAAKSPERSRTGSSTEAAIQGTSIA